MILMQQQQDTLNVVQEGLTSPVLQDQIELWELVTKGGWIMDIGPQDDKEIKFNPRIQNYKERQEDFDQGFVIPTLELELQFKKKKKSKR